MQTPDAEKPPSEEYASVPQVAKDLARFAREQNVTDLPSDFAENHDHYLHGAPKGIDQP